MCSRAPVRIHLCGARGPRSPYRACACAAAGGQRRAGVYAGGGGRGGGAAGGPRKEAGARRRDAIGGAAAGLAAAGADGPRSQVHCEKGGGRGGGYNVSGFAPTEAYSMQNVPAWNGHYQYYIILYIFYPFQQVIITRFALVVIC